ncbi:MAG: GAF domain-containing protein [bacterium]|nr:GAF domain-containing protein [bacterium]
MKNLSRVQQAIINIFKVSTEESSLEKLVRTCHNELEGLIGKDKAGNFYLALYVGDYKYVLPYYFDEKDKDPVNEAISLKGGLTDYIRQKGQTECIDSKKHEALMAEGKLEMVGADSYQWVGAPLITDGIVFGVLVVQTYDPSVAYSEDDIQLIDFVSNNITEAINKKNKEKELTEHKNNLEKLINQKTEEIVKKNAKLKTKITRLKKSEQVQKVLYNISEAKSNTPSLWDLLRIIHEQIGTLMQAVNFYVATVVDKEKGLFQFPYIIDENPGELESSDTVVDLLGGFTDYVTKTEKPLLVDEKTVLEMGKKSEIQMLGKIAQSWLGIPLKTDGDEILGVVAVQSYSDKLAYSNTDKKILSIISTTIAGAIKYKQLEEEKNSLEEKLIESQKMEAVGILAAGVAHEFNNLLSIITGHAYNGIRLSDRKSADYKRFSKIEKASERAAELIEKLMIFAQKRDRGRIFIENIETAIQEAVVRLKNKVSDNDVPINMHIGEELWPVKIDSDEIHELLTNILDNSLYAICDNEDGRIDIYVENFKGKPRTSPIGNVGKYIYLRISDNGCGMDEDTRNNAFNPFFTTKPPGKGTGMGLSIVYATIQEYYGTVELESEKDKGTTIHVYLPTTAFLS